MIKRRTAKYLQNCKICKRNKWGWFTLYPFHNKMSIKEIKHLTKHNEINPAKFGNSSRGIKFKTYKCRCGQMAAMTTGNGLYYCWHCWSLKN